MADNDFESLEAIEKHFGKQRKAAGDDEAKVAALALEEREAKADFREKQAAKRELDAHRKELLTGVDWPDEVKEMLAGDSIEALDASHKRLAAMYEKITAKANDTAADATYGGPLPKGGGTPPPPKQTEDDKFRVDFSKRWNNKEPVTEQERDRFIKLMLGQHMAYNLSETSPRFRRSGVTPEKVVASIERGQN